MKIFPELRLLGLLRRIAKALEERNALERYRVEREFSPLANPCPECCGMGWKTDPKTLGGYPADIRTVPCMTCRGKGTLPDRPPKLAEISRPTLEEWNERWRLRGQ